MTLSSRRTAVFTVAARLSRIEARLGGEGIADEAGEVHRAEETGAIGRQRLLAARVGGADGLAIVQVVAGIDAVDEDDAGLGHVIGGAHDALPQIARLDGPVGLAGKHQRPVAVRLHRRHELIAHQHRQVEHAQALGVALDIDEGLDVGVVAGHRRHHGAAARTGRHDGAAHGIPHVHEAQRPRGIGPHALDRRAARTQRGEIMADTAALLQGEGGFLEVLEDAAHGIVD